MDLMGENPYQAPRSSPETEIWSPEPDRLSLNDVWGMVRGWGSLVFLLALIDALSVWVFTSRLRTIIGLSATGILALIGIMWFVCRRR